MSCCNTVCKCGRSPELGDIFEKYLCPDCLCKTFNEIDLQESQEKEIPYSPV